MLDLAVSAYPALGRCAQRTAPPRSAVRAHQTASGRCNAGWWRANSVRRVWPSPAGRSRGGVRRYGTCWGRAAALCQVETYPGPGLGGAGRRERLAPGPGPV